MKKLAIYGIALLAISGCGLFQAPPSPTPQKVDFNLSQIGSGAQINVVALIPADIPNSSQPKVTNTALFRVSEDLIGQPNSSVLIAQNSFITAVYSNDGKICQLSWQGLYPDYRSMELGHGSLDFGSKVNNTSCDPKAGIRPGQIFNIVFK